VLINFILFLTALFLFSGLALDAGMLEFRKLQLQHAADAAALGAIYEKARGYSDWVAAGQADAAMNGFTNGVNGVTISIVSPPTSGTYAGNTSAIQATVTQSVPTAFMGLASGSGSASPGAISVAMPSSYADCLYIMGSGSGFYPLLIQSSTNVSSACSIYIDSTSKSIENDSGNTLSVTGGNSINVQGASSGALLSGTTSPSPTFGSSNQNDPLSGLTAPVFSSCTYTSKSVTSSSATLSPGTYCNGITLNHATVTFQPGLYIITGTTSWTNSSTISGTGVTLYLTQGGGYSFGYFTISNSTVTLSAPTSGSLTGIVIFGDRAASAPGVQGAQISSSYVTTDGIWYILNTGIYLSSSTLRGINYLGVVTDNLKLSGATLTVPSPSYTSLTGGSPYEGSTTGGLVQ
jgi:putative Flp pilus-assembly TadE/G-like protein